MTKQLCLVFFSLLLFTCNKSDDNPGLNLGDAPVNPDQQLLVDLINAARANGYACGNTNAPAAPLVSWNDQLEAAAKKHSAYMNQVNQLTHAGENNSSFFERISAEGYDWSSAAENVAKGLADEESVIQSWLDSEAHCLNLLDPNVDEIGVGTSGPYWTIDLGKSN